MLEPPVYRESFQCHMFKMKRAAFFLARTTFPGSFLLQRCSGVQPLLSFSGPLSVAQAAETGRDVKRMQLCL